MNGISPVFIELQSPHRLRHRYHTGTVIQRKQIQHCQATSWEVIKAPQITEPRVIKPLLTFSLPIAFLLAVSKGRHLQGHDSWVLQDVHLHPEPPYQLLGPDADGVFVFPQSPLQKFLVMQYEPGLHLARNEDRGLECLIAILPERKIQRHLHIPHCLGLQSSM